MGTTMSVSHSEPATTATATHMLVHTEATAHMRATEATEVPTAGTVTATHMVRVPTPDMDTDTHTAVPTLDFTAVPTLDSTDMELDTEVPTVGMAMDTHTLVPMLDMVDTVASMVLDMVATDGMAMDTHTRHLSNTTAP